MKVFYLGNNWTAWQILEWLGSGEDQVVGLAIHPPAKQAYTEEIVAAANLPQDRIFDGSTLRKGDVLNSVEACGADIAVSVLFDYILRPEFLRLFSQEAINVHPAYLPYNRGQYPNVWSIVEGTPSGVTIHFLDEGIDTGDIIARSKVEVNPSDTGESLYRKLERESVRLFKKTWPLIRAGEAPREPQVSTRGTYHSRADVESIDRIDPDAMYRAGDLIDILRARTFPPYPGAYLERGQRRVYLRLHLIDEDALESKGGQ